MVVLLYDTTGGFLFHLFFELEIRVEIKVRSLREADNNNYTFLEKSKFEPRENFFVALVLSYKGQEKIYLIPSMDWKNPNPNGFLKNYKKEWGISISEKSKEELKQYEFDKMIEKLKLNEVSQKE